MYNKNHLLGSKTRGIEKKTSSTAYDQSKKPVPEDREDSLLLLVSNQDTMLLWDFFHSSIYREFKT